jgi:hypothetical protein
MQRFVYSERSPGEAHELRRCNRLGAPTDAAQLLLHVKARDVTADRGF